MFSSQFLSRTNCSLFLAVPTVRRAMRHSLLLRRPPTLPSSSSSSAPPSTAAVFSHGFSVKEEQQQQKQQQQQQQPNANQQTDERGLVELTLRLQDQLAKIGERVAHANNVIQQQATAFSHLQRQQAVLERRVVTLEEEDARMQQRITETTRLASDLVLQHRNVEMLVGQMEKLVLKHTTTYSVKGGKPLSAANTFPPSTGSHGEKQTLQHATNTGSSASDVQTNSKPMMAVAPPSHSASLSSSSVAVSPDLLRIETQVSTISVRLEALQARIDQLTLEKLVLDKVELHAQTLQRKTQEQQETVVEQAVSRVATAAMTKDERGGAVGSAAHSKKNLAALLKNAGAFPFRDNTGATRISSQKVLVRGLPVMFGASEVRDLFSRAGTVVSCVVRRMSTVRTAAKTTTAPPAAASRYLSQQNQEEEEGNEEKKVGEKESSDQITNGSSGAATVTSTAAEKQERAFEVTYQTVEQAVRAVLQLEGYQLHGKYTLSVEPVVSADIIAAMQQLEEEFKEE